MLLELRFDNHTCYDRGTTWCGSMLRTLCRRIRKADHCKCSTQNRRHFNFKLILSMDYPLGRPVARNSAPDQPTTFLPLRMLPQRVTRECFDLSSNGNASRIHRAVRHQDQFGGREILSPRKSIFLSSGSNRSNHFGKSLSPFAI